MIFNLFSKRQKEIRGEVVDVYVYDQIPDHLRRQLVIIGTETLGVNAHEPTVYNAYEEMVKILCREYGLFNLYDKNQYGERKVVSEFADFLLQEPDTERVIDAVEIMCIAIDQIARKWDHLRISNSGDIADAALAEINARFKEHGVGYQFISGEVIRVDSELLHSEVVKPALVLMHKKEYRGAEDEFLKAHEHYRHGREKEALNECLKSFESLMKAICDKRGWSYKKNGTAKDLIEACLSNDLIPAFWQTSFASLRSLLESGVPTGRNKLGGHGQGGTPTNVPPYLVSYMLHMTASTLVFLAEAEAALP